jgi:integrase
LTPPQEQQDINALASLLQSKGLDAGDFIDVINALANIKKRDQERIEQQESGTAEQEKKIFKDKEFIFDTRKDVFIYKDGRTKSGRYYIRIYDDKTKKVFSQSLKTTNRIEALASAENIYAENKDRMRRGVKLISLTTKELITTYLRLRFKERTNIPHAGITIGSYDNLIKQLKYWEEYITDNKHGKTKIEDIPPEIGLGFANWILAKPKDTYANDRYKGKERSRQSINRTVAAVKKMYKDIAIERRYITQAESPIFKYLKVQKDASPKRDVLTEEEYTAIRRWIQYKWVNEKDVNNEEKIKRRLYSLFFTIHHNTGCRCKEILGIRWRDINVISTDKPEDKQIRRSINIDAENSKTGVGRKIVSPNAVQFEQIKKIYKSIGVECGRDDYVFQHTAKTKRGKNIAWGQPLIDKRLKAVCEGSAAAGEWEPNGRRITNYSARHYYATQAIMRKVDIYDLALNMGTSITYLQNTYIHTTALMKADDMTKGQGIYKLIEEQATSKGRDYILTDENNIKVGAAEYNEEGGIKLHYQEYYNTLDRVTQKIDDFAWLDFMKMDSRMNRKEVEEYENTLIKKWGSHVSNEEMENYEKEQAKHIKRIKQY